MPVPVTGMDMRENSVRYTTPVIPLILLLSGCVTYFDDAYVGMPTYEVTRNVTEDGRSNTYRLQLDGASSFLDVTTEYDRQVVDLGLAVWELDKRQASELDVRPYIGLLVRDVGADSPADRAGMQPGDIVLSLNGEEVIYRDQFRHQVDRLPVGEPISVRISRGAAPGVEMELSVTPRLRDERVRTTKRVPLEVPLSNRSGSYAGMMLRVIPQDWSCRMYDGRTFTAVVGGVVLGSPAYLAGLRAGDVIESMDGRPVRSVDETQRVLQEKGRRKEALSVAVERGADNRFETDLALKDYTGSTNINVPLIFDLENSVRRTDWSFGPGSIIAGYENRYEVSYDRDPKTRGSYSMLLGLFKQSWSPNGNRTRLLWFITFGG